MRRVMYTGRKLLTIILEELIELDKRTDLSKMAIRYVSLNDDDLYDDVDSSGGHFGIVSAALALAALPLVCKGLSFIILILQALH